MELKKAFSLGLSLCVVLASGYQQAEAQKLRSSPEPSGDEQIINLDFTESLTNDQKVHHVQGSIPVLKKRIYYLSGQGKLVRAKADVFKKRLSVLEQEAKSAQAKNWPTAIVADLMKKVALFDSELSTASSSAKLINKKKAKDSPSKPGTTDKLQFFKAPRTLEIIDSTPLINDKRTAPATPGATTDRRPMVGGGDSKPQGAAGRNE